MSKTDTDILNIGQEVLRRESQALQQLTERLDGPFVEMVRDAAACSGHVVLSGVGKAYIIAQKISASLASTGTPSFALHPVDALHGDLGRVRRGDLALLLSNSGETPEIVECAAALAAFEVKRYAVTAQPESRLASHCDTTISLGAIEEADAYGIAPTTSTTMMLALGDALTLATAELRGWSRDGFAMRHPGGALGRRLAKVERLMRPLENTATVSEQNTLIDTLHAISEKRCGAAFLVDAEGALRGILTDGDVRRYLTKHETALRTPVVAIATHKAKSCVRGTLVGEAMTIMKEHQIDELPVVDSQGRLLGHLDLLDLV